MTTLILAPDSCSTRSAAGRDRDELSFREQLHRNRQAPLADTATAKVHGVLHGVPAQAELARWHLEVVRLKIDELGQRGDSTSQCVAGSGDTVEAEGEAPPIVAADYRVSMAIAATTANSRSADLGFNCQEPVPQLGSIQGRATRLTFTLLEAATNKLAHMAERCDLTGSVVGNVEIELLLYGEYELYRINAHVLKTFGVRRTLRSPAGDVPEGELRSPSVLHFKGFEGDGFLNIVPVGCNC